MTPLKNQHRKAAAYAAPSSPGPLPSHFPQAGPPAMVLGTRSFTGNVPARSGFGNNATRLLFTLATGERISGTQTGLRGYPASMLPWLRSVHGERYEYELNLLLEARRAGYAHRERGRRRSVPGP